MIISKKVQIAFIVVLVLTAFVCGQDEKKTNDEQKLREEILSIYKSKGKKGLIDFVKEKKDKISNKFIVDFAMAGKKERKEEWLKTCEIVAEEQMDEKTLAEVYYNMGEYHRNIPDYKTTDDYFKKALQLYGKLSNSVGQGNIYQSMGLICIYTADNARAPGLFEKALFFFKKAGDLKGQGYVHLGKGYICFLSGDIKRALEHCNKALHHFKKAKDSQGQGNIYRIKGDIFLRTINKSKALEMYEKAIIFFEETGDLIGQGNVYKSRGNICFFDSNYSNAIEMYEIALACFKKGEDIIGQANVYLSKGDVYYHVGNRPKAIEMYDKALIFFEKAKDIIGQGNVYQIIGDINFHSGNNLKAFEMYSKAMIFFEKSGEPIGQGNVYKSLGNLYLRTSNYKKALEMYDKALPLFEKGGDPLGQGGVYFGKGNIYLYSGNNSRAIKMYDKSLVYYEKVGSFLDLGNVYRSKGDIYLRTSDYLRAFHEYEKSLHFFEKATNPKGLGDAYRSRGNIYKKIGDYSKALEMYDKSMHFYKKVGDPLDMGEIHRSKGEVYLNIRNHSKAIEMYNKAIHLVEKIENSHTKENSLFRIGIIHFLDENYLKALEAFDRALDFYIKSKTPAGQAHVYKAKAYLYFKNGNYQKSLAMFNKALLIYAKIGDIDTIASAFSGKASALVKLGKKNEALKLFEKGITNLEKVRRQIVFSEMQRNFLKKVYHLYEDTVLFMLENKYYEKASKYAESMRARVFLDQMAEGLRSLEKGLKLELKEERDKLVGKLSALSRQMQEVGGKEEKKLLKLKEEYRRVESKFEDLLIKIRLDNPLYASVNYPQPISVQELQKYVLKKGETLLSYFISREKAYAFIISKDHFNVKQLKVNGDQIKNLVDRYLPAIKENDANDIKRFGSILYEKLFKPLEKYLDKNSDIIIVPMGELETIPFESLVVDKKKPGRPVYLLEKYRVKYVQGATLLSILRKYYTRDNTSKGFIGFGDPVYDYENFKQAKPEQGGFTRSPGDEDEIKEIHSDRYARAGGIMDRLPQSGDEIKTIARLFENVSLNSTVHLRDQASEENAKAVNMKDFAYIHFSCHGLLNENFQSLVLSQLPPDKSSEDGYFTLNEIMNCDYNAKLVVLSACQTGKGKMYKGEGVTGLTRAVMYAGTPAVVASLWDVDDRATKELMVTFYKNMLEKNMDKVEALRQAKLQLLKIKKYSSPLFWSSFVMYGE